MSSNILSPVICLIFFDVIVLEFFSRVGSTVEMYTSVLMGSDLIIVTLP